MSRQLLFERARGEQVAEVLDLCVVRCEARPLVLQSTRDGLEIGINVTLQQRQRIAQASYRSLLAPDFLVV